MKSRATVLSLAVFAFGAVALAMPASATTTAVPRTMVATPVDTNTWAQRHHYKELYGWGVPTGVNFATLEHQAAVGKTVPYFTATVKSPIDGKTYSYRMVGTSPFASKKSSTTVDFELVELRFHFSDGTVLDPTAPSCGDSKSAVYRLLHSPILVNNITYTSNGQNVGTTQFEDAFQRADFWKYTKGTNFHVLLKQTGTILFDVTVPSNEGFAQSGNCAPIGNVNDAWFDAGYQAALKKYVDKPNEFAFGINYNTVLYVGNPNSCCVIGYHNVVGENGGTASQTYSDSAYMDQGDFSDWNIATVTHEVGEWMDDPFVVNPTPAWGHIGQQSGCQNNLEVGDPLSGTVFHVTTNGFNYEVQDLTFFSWFYRQVPSIGTGGKYSLGGTFTHDAGAICH